MVALLLFFGTVLGVAPAAAAGADATGGMWNEAAPMADIDLKVMNCYSSATELHYWRSEDPRYYYSIAQARWTPADTDMIRVPRGYWAEIRRPGHYDLLRGNEWYSIHGSWHGLCVYIHHSTDGAHNPLT